MPEPIRVHEGVVGTAQSALNRLSAALKRDGALLRVLKDAEEQVGAVKVRGVVLEVRDRESDPSPDGTVLMLLEQGGVTLPLELTALNAGELHRAASCGTITKDLAARDAQFAGVSKTVADGYARGEQAQVYDFTDSGLTPEADALGGMAVQAEVNPSTLAFLPGGVFLNRPGEPDMPHSRPAPDGDRRAARALAQRARWVRGHGPGRSAHALPLWSGGRKAAQPHAGGRHFLGDPTAEGRRPDRRLQHPQPVVQRRGLAPGNLGISSCQDRNLELLADGRYQSSTQRFTTISGSGVGGGSRQSAAGGGAMTRPPAP